MRSHLTCKASAKDVFLRRNDEIRPWITSGEGRLNIQLLARAFGLRPETLELNGRMPTYGSSGLTEFSVDEAFPDAGHSEDSAIVCIWPAGSRAGCRCLKHLFVCAHHCIGLACHLEVSQRLPADGAPCGHARHNRCTDR